MFTYNMLIYILLLLKSTSSWNIYHIYVSFRTVSERYFASQPNKSFKRGKIIYRTRSSTSFGTIEHLSTWLSIMRQITLLKLPLDIFPSTEKFSPRVPQIIFLTGNRGRRLLTCKWEKATFAFVCICCLRLKDDC